MSITTLVMGVLILLQGAGGSAGMVVAVSGKVSLQRGTAQSAPRLAELLQTGDRIRVESGNATLLFCPTSERIVLGAGTTVELQANAVRVVAGPQPTRAAARCALPQVALGQESLERIGGVRGRGNPPIALLTGGPVTTTRPVFEWAPVGKAPAYQVALKNQDEDVLWQQRTTETTVAYPANMAPLAPGLYSWEVRAQEDGKVVGEQTANFEVKPATQFSPARASDPAAMLIEATALENAGYYAEAAAYFRELQKLDPSDERIARRLAWLYWSAGLITATNNQMQNIK
jgi:tetratricopeptide (TPR) repeat protein